MQKATIPCDDDLSDLISKASGCVPLLPDLENDEVLQSLHWGTHDDVSVQDGGFKLKTVTPGTRALDIKVWNDCFFAASSDRDPLSLW